MRRHAISQTEDKLADFYYNHYTSQEGGQLPVFRGQSGDGLGDILRGLLKRFIPYVMPVVKSGVSSFITGASQGLAEGKSLKDSMKGAVRPSIANAVEKVAQEIQENGTEMEQSGGGRRVYKPRKRRCPKNKTAQKKPRFSITTLPTNF